MQHSFVHQMEAMFSTETNATGTDAGVLNVTLQLTTADLLPVSAVVQAASKVWVSPFAKPDCCLGLQNSTALPCSILNL